MPTFEQPTADAGEAQEALRGLAHATRAITDPADVYDVLGSLSRAVASLEQTLHQLAAFHDGPGPQHASVHGDTRAGRAASYQVSWELHRAAEIAGQAAAAVAHAHQIEADIAYQQPDPPTADVPAPPTATPGLSL